MRNITKTLFLLITLLFVSCNNNDDVKEEEASLEYTNLKTIEIGDYKIEVPSQFNLIEEQGSDSYVGRVEGSGIKIQFDYGFYGGAFNYLSEDDFEFVNETFGSVERQIVIGNISEEYFTGVFIRDLDDFSIDINAYVSLKMYVDDLASVEEQNLAVNIFESATLIE